MADEQQREITIIVGPCTRERLDDALIDLRELMDERHPDLGAAVAGAYTLREEPTREED